MSCLTGMLPLLACAIGAGELPGTWDGAPLMLSRLADAPGDALIRQVAPDANRSAATEVVTRDPKTGIEIRQRHRWVPDRRVLVVDSTLTNTRQTATNVGEVSLVNWAFRVADGADGMRYRKLTYRNDVWYGSTYWTGPNWTRVGKDWHHPGINTPSVRRFTAPRDGRVTITGRVYKLDTKNGGGDGVRLSIRHGAHSVWKAEIDGDDAKGVEPRVSLDVRKGDAIRFVVHKRGRITCDTTRWDPVVTYTGGGPGAPAGQRYRASEAFSTSKQGQGGRSYEMEVDPSAETRLPAVHGYGLDLSLRDRTAVVGKPIVATHRDALPLFVVSDGHDKSGIVLALTQTGPWRFATSLARDGRLRLELAASGATGAYSLKAGQSIRLPRTAVGAYQGQWLAAISMFQRLLAGGQGDETTDGDHAGVGGLRQQIAAAFRRATARLGADLEPCLKVDPASDRRSIELDLWTMVQMDWRQQDKIAETADAYAAAMQRHIKRARQLLADLQRSQGGGSARTDRFFADRAVQLDRLAALAGRTDLGLDERRTLYVRTRWAKRQIALANPLMAFGRLLFCKRVPTSYSHLVMQYYGWRARPGGGIFVLDSPGHSLASRNVFTPADAARIAEGNVLEPRLSYDGKRIVFSYVRCGGRKYDYNKLDNKTDEGFYHIYEVNVDGTGLRQLTRGPYDDLMPTYLPDGGIAFCSTRRRGYARCFGGQFSRRWHVYTLHRMDGDGGNIRTLSFNDVNEWFPAVSNTGRILYSRWDYIDRDAVTHQNLWATRPDGTNPVAVWGNATASPHCTFQLQPIPGTSKIVFAASAHHSIAGGSIAIVDPALGVDGQQAITRLTPEIPFPEAEGRNIKEYYAAPWPLSEKYFLVAYSPKPLVWEPGANFRDALGIYLLDAFGNRELIYRDPDIGSTNSCPLVARPKPPVVPSHLPVDTAPTGEMVLLDVYQGLGPIRRGHIKALRIIQIFPKSTNVANTPPIGMAREENGRAVLGTVPIEADGSARFIVPASKPLLFQVLDKDGFAYQTMRSLTYVQPGERLSCIGCHEDRMTAPGAAVALSRPASKITPGPFDGQPFSYVRVVQPVLDKHCVKCHGGPKPKKGIDLTGKPHKGFTRSYWSLCSDRNFTGAGTSPKNAAEALVPRFGARNQIQITPPGGMYGALGSRLIKMLRKGHNDVKLSDDDLRRLAMWIDCNAIFYGVNLPDDQTRQLRGQVVAMPQIQ